jgi:transforming growth factor-beta-induced protein
VEGSGPFTVFAPVNSAFLGLGPLLGWALNPYNVKSLDNILTYHVVSGNYQASSLSNGQQLATLDGQNVTVSIAGSSVKINNAPVLTANVEATNGVIHIIGGVLVPTNSGVPTQNVVQLAQSVPTLSTLVTAVVTANATQLLSTAAPITVFAPTNTAFNNLPAGELQYLLQHPQELFDVLAYHVLGAVREYSTEIPAGQSIQRTLNGQDLAINNANGAVTINKVATVVSANNDAVNGVVHVIDTVLIPAGVAKRMQKALRH